MTDLLWEMSATELATAYRTREVSPVEAVQAVLARIEAVDPVVNAFVTTVPEQALAAARAAEHRFVNEPAEDLPALLGIPVSVKDLTDTAGVRTTYGSVHYKDHVPDRDTVGWARLKAAGAVLVGKTCTPEFGMLGVTESPLTGTTNNPWNPATTAGGSSGGAAAAVAAGCAPLAWGSDGGGSIRIPASCCGVVGLKASMGRIPVHGEGDVYGSVDTSGPLTRTVTDCALMLQATAGPDLRDPLSLPASPTPFTDALRDLSLCGLRIAYSADLGHGHVASQVLRRVEEAGAVFTDVLGASVRPVEVELPDPLQYFQDFWAPAFAVGLRDLVEAHGWDPGASHPMISAIGDLASSRSAVDHWRTSVQTRARISEGFAAVFADYDLLITPTMPTTVFPHPGPAGGPAENEGHPVAFPAIDFHRLTEPASHAGLPALSVPCGFDDAGLPVGLQIIGPHHADAAVLQAAAAFEQATAWHTRRPPLPSPPPSPSGDAL
ncbi:amidase [Streptomyces sp. NPDC001027]|uniref:amidase n=1 Tax=Streptomyces sp. NPDC001027 TaxID=3154771 RepID=UPI00331C1849